MFEDPAFDAFFVRIVETLRPYLSDLVSIGGCANALYRNHPSAAAIPFRYLGTKDSDWATPQKLPLRGPAPVASLMTDAGFKETALGTGQTPVVKYILADESLPADVEFLCPLSGIPGGRDGAGSTAHQVQDGLLAQPLRYLELLLHRTWELDLGRVPEFAQMQGTIIRIPNPAAYAVQKVLIRDQQRAAQSAAKDCYYIYEISVIFRDNLDLLAKEYSHLQEKFS
ncbi:MAG: GSU2403 family nucleotidyltransferase fold protein [Verrucomicrobia bacterium]|nr:GSU2403 family nucleotidyltransferase fold protein [Verrucomicrobiota bacterium]